MVNPMKNFQDRRSIEFAKYYSSLMTKSKIVPTGDPTFLKKQVMILFDTNK